MSKWRKPRVYQGVGHKAEKKPYTDQDSRWVCPKCGCGVKRRKGGETARHAIDGGNVTRDNIPCIGSGEKAKLRPGLKVRPPKLSAPDGTVDA